MNTDLEKQNELFFFSLPLRSTHTVLFFSNLFGLDIVFLYFFNIFKVHCSKLFEFVLEFNSNEEQSYINANIYACDTST